jgi:hypothetical protein
LTGFRVFKYRKLFANELLRKGLSETKIFRFCENIMPNPDYRKIFEELKSYCPESDDLNKLATVMSGHSRFIDAALSERILEGLHDLFITEPKPIPAGYTYLSQLMIHDISFDERSDRHSRDDRPWEVLDPEKIKELRNLRKPNFDLETLYGHEVAPNPGETPRAQLMQQGSLPLLKLGPTKRTSIGTNTRYSYPSDLPRGDSSVLAEIADPRNDENLLLAQTLVAFIKFHNAMVVELSKSGNYTYDALFKKARKLTIRYYQTIILTDFLPRVVQDSVLKYVGDRAGTEELFYKPKPDDMFIPLEFSVAAFRFGHSMIRRGYNLNAANTNATLDQIMLFTGRGKMDGNPLRVKLPSNWIINWNSFYEINGPALNNAEDINTQLPQELLQLRPKVSDNSDGRASSLAALDLFRGRRFGLPTGQDIAERLYGKEAVLSADDISRLILNKQIYYTHEDEAARIKKRMSDVFSENTPLWFYILAEAELQKDGKLGAVGSRIVAETIYQLLYYSEYSILQEKWETDEGCLIKNEKFDMPGMLKFIQDVGQRHFNVLYPNVADEFDELNPLKDG